MEVYWLKKSLKILKVWLEVIILKKDRQYHGQKKKLWSTKHYKENYRLSNTNQLQTGGKLRCHRRVNISCFTSGSYCVTLVLTCLMPILICIDCLKVFRYSVIFQLISSISYEFRIQLDWSKTGTGGSPCRHPAVISCFAWHSPLYH